MIKRFLPLLLLPMLSSCAARADVKPMALFGDHMVLQRDKPIAVFGTADANEPIRVSLGFKQAATVADAAGKWRVMLPPMASSALTYDLTIAGRDATKAIVLHDVAIGEVWLCSGQSNMEMSLKGVQNAGAEIETANDSQLRLFTVPHAMLDTPQSDVKGQWAATTPDTARSFSAAAYFFGRELRQKLGVPVGLIHSSWGGTAAETWTSRQTLESTPELAKMGANFGVSFQKAQDADAAYNRSMAEWQAKADAAKAAGQPEPDNKPVKPGRGNWQRPSGLFNGMIAPLAPFGIRGVIWYQGEANAGRAPEYRTLFPAMITNWRQTFAQGDFPFIYVQLANHNARQDPSQPPSENGWAALREAQRLTLQVPKTGMATIIDTSSDGNLHPPEKQPVGHRLALWALKGVYNQDVPQSGPLFQSAILEGNQIRLKFSHTDGGLMNPPIGIPWQPVVAQAADYPYVPQGHWAYAAFDRLVRAGIIGNYLSGTYNGNKPMTRYEFAVVVARLRENIKGWEKNKIGPDPLQPKLGSNLTSPQAKELFSALQTEFRDESGLLGVRVTAINAEIPVPRLVQGFAIAGADKKFVWAQAQIEGDSVVVSSAQVAQPVWVRYAWAENPIGNLYNGAGLPASPFEAHVASVAGN